MNEAKIINLIRSGRQEKAFKLLYKLYPKVKNYITHNSGTSTVAQDIFQEALIIIYRKIYEGVDEDFKCEGYLYTTCKLLWSNELRKKKLRKGDDEELQCLRFYEDISVKIEQEDKIKLIEKCLFKLGEKCRLILEQFYYKSFSMERIASMFGYSTVESAKVQKYKCIEAARKLVLETYSREEI